MKILKSKIIKIFACLLGDEEPNGESILSEYCSLKEFVRPPVVCQRKSSAVDQEGFLLCPESSASHSRLSQMARPPK